MASPPTGPSGDACIRPVPTLPVHPVAFRKRAADATGPSGDAAAPLERCDAKSTISPSLSPPMFASTVPFTPLGFPFGSAEGARSASSGKPSTHQTVVSVGSRSVPAEGTRSTAQFGGSAHDLIDVANPRSGLAEGTQPTAQVGNQLQSPLIASCQQHTLVIHPLLQTSPPVSSLQSHTFLASQRNIASERTVLGHVVVAGDGLANSEGTRTEAGPSLVAAAASPPNPDRRRSGNDRGISAEIPSRSSP